MSRFPQAEEWDCVVFLTYGIPVPKNLFLKMLLAAAVLAAEQGQGPGWGNALGTRGWPCSFSSSLLAQREIFWSILSDGCHCTPGTAQVQQGGSLSGQTEKRLGKR